MLDERQLGSTEAQSLTSGRLAQRGGVKPVANGQAGHGGALLRSIRSGEEQDAQTDLTSRRDRGLADDFPGEGCSGKGSGKRFLVVNWPA